MHSLTKTIRVHTTFFLPVGPFEFRERGCGYDFRGNALLRLYLLQPLSQQSSSVIEVSWYARLHLIQYRSFTRVGN